MKKKDLENLKTKTLEDLRRLLQETKKEKLAQIVESSMGKVKNVHEIKSKKQDIAKIMTIMKLKELSSRTEKKEVKSASK